MNKIRFNILIFIGFVTLGTFTGCDDMESTHEEYLKGEKIYAGKLDSLVVYSGYKRVKIVGQTRYLGNSVEAVVQWGDNEQIFQIADISSGLFEMFIESLEERSYEFTVYTIDNDGNKSILQTTRGKSIGDIFKNSQLSRRITEFVDSDDGLTAIWADKAESPFIITTMFSYETTSGQMKTVEVAPDDMSIVLNSWKSGGKTEILSKIITGEYGIDTLALDVVNGVLPD